MGWYRPSCRCRGEKGKKSKKIPPKGLTTCRRMGYDEMQVVKPVESTYQEKHEE